MSIQKIVSSVKIQVDELEARFPRFWTDLSVNDVSAVLRIVSETFYSLHRLARESDGADESKFLTQEQLQRILGLFGELENNFFPMAHTQERLGRLKIINGEEGNRLHSFQEHSICKLSEQIRIMSLLLKEMQREFNDLKESREQMRTVLNP